MDTSKKKIDTEENRMKIVSGKDKYEIIAMDTEDNILGKGYIYDSIASELYEIDRVNFFIEFVTEVEDKEYVIRDFIVDELVKRAKEQRKKYPDYDARVYHCCFSDDKENIEFYSRIEGFKHDEGMHIITCDLDNFNKQTQLSIKYEIKEDNLNTDEEIQDFINEHSKIFRSVPYNIEKIRKLKDKEGFKNIAIYDNGQMVANILLLIKEESGIKFGCLEDVFVSKDYRNKKLGEYLVTRALEYFKSIGLNESRLEVWSSNVRASNLYYKLGYKFMIESESSIGMSI